MKLKKDGTVLLIITLLLSIFGVYMVYSASWVWAENKLGDNLYYLKRQTIFACLGIILLFLGIRLDRQILYKYYKIILIIGISLLIIVIIPGVGIVRGGSQSWFGLGSFAIQPAEFFKLAIIIYASVVLGAKYERTDQFLKKIMPVLAVALVGFGVILLQPDFGTGVVMIGAVVAMSLISKVPLKPYIRLSVLAAVGFGAMIISAPYRLARITAFIDPWQDPLGTGFQIIQSLFAIGPGGITGHGLDSSIQKHFYLPEPQTDFIFAIVAEEFGLLGALIVIFLFYLLLSSGLKIARKAKNSVDSFLGFGIIILLSIQVIINLGVVVGLMPVTGVTLPLISYGGSSLTITLFGLGILVGIDREEKV